MTTTFTPSLFSSLAGVIRSHSRTHEAGVLDGYADDTAPEVQAEENTPVVVADSAGVSVEEIATSDATEIPEQDAPQVRDEPTTPVEAVAIDTDSVHDDDSDDSTDGTSEPAADSSAEGDGLTWSAVPTAVEEIDTSDDDLDIDVSSYLPGGVPTRPAASSESSRDVAPEPVAISTPVNDTPVTDAGTPEADISEPAPSDDDDLDLGDFNPMKYLSGGSGSAVSEPVASSEPAPETPTIPVEASEITPRDPLSLLRELASLSR